MINTNIEPVVDSAGNIVPKLNRDLHTGALIVTDEAGFRRHEYQQNVEQRLRQQQVEIGEIRSMLAKILSSINKQ